jgi:hypothetical protein
VPLVSGSRHAGLCIAASALARWASGQMPLTVTRTVVVGGMPGWQIVLIAAGAAPLAAVLAILADRARTAHRRAARRRPEPCSLGPGTLAERTRSADPAGMS